MQAHDLVVVEAEHAFDLMVATFDDTQSCAAVVEDRQLGWQRGQVLEGEVKAFGEFLDVMLADVLLGFDAVDLREFGGGLGQTA